MKWNPKDPHGPFDAQGNLQHYPLALGWSPRVEPEWRQVRPWWGTLSLEGYARGRSAAYFEMVDESGHTYPMMISDFAELVKSRTVAHGAVYTRWALAKRGQNYGIRLAKVGE